MSQLTRVKQNIHEHKDKSCNPKNIQTHGPCALGVPQNHTIYHFLTPNCLHSLYSLYNFYGATMTIKGSLFCSTPMLKQFSAAKNQVQSKSVPKMAVFFWKFKGLNIKYSYWDPQKALPYTERRLLTYFA